MYKIKTYLLAAVILCIFYPEIQGQQNKSDSLRNILEKEKNDTLRLKALIKLSDYYSFQNSDSAILYAKQATILAKKTKSPKFLIESLMELGWSYFVSGNYTTALDNYFEALKVSANNNDQSYVSSLYGNIGAVYREIHDAVKAKDYYFKALKIDEKSGNKDWIASDISNIGIIFMEEGNFQKALEFYFKALKINEELGNKREIAIKLGNIGNVYVRQAETIVLPYQRDSLYSLALDYYFKALKIDKELERKTGIAIKLGNIGKVYSKIEKYKEAENFLQRALALSDSIGAIDLMDDWHQNLSELYELTGQNTKAFEHYKKYIILRDSLFNEDNLKKTTKLEMNFEFEKKEAVTNAVHNKQIALAEAEKKKQQIIIWTIVVGLFLVIIFAGFIFYSLQITKKQKGIIEKQKQTVDEKNSALNNLNEELNSRNEEILNQRDEIETQRDLVINQKKELEQIHSQLTDSIRYAKRIQNAVLPNESQIKEIFSNLSKNEHPDYFILFKPRNIVSGDFYFVVRRNEWILLAVADCTGHGVPGAFMSMLGISFLNEIVSREEVKTASHVLNEMRRYIIKSLQQRTETGNLHSGQRIQKADLRETQSVKDGMDLTFVAINTETLKMQFAGANNPLYIVRKSESINPTAIGLKEENRKLSDFELSDFRLSDFRLYELKGDKMPVSIYLKMDEFTNHEIQLQKNDAIYMFSDGFPDQFGGPSPSGGGKKFLLRSLKEKIIEISGKSMSDQKIIFENTLQEWRSANGIVHEQTDDITMVGLRI